MSNAAVAIDPLPLENPFVSPEGTIPLVFGKHGVNVSDETLMANVKSNIRRHLPQLDVFALSEKPIAIVAGGWSLVDTFDKIREYYFNGMPLIALNGAGNWLMERNVRPSIQIVMDARPENLVFIEKPIPRCRYFIAAQCDPILFDVCEGRDVTIFHMLSTDSDEEVEVEADADADAAAEKAPAVTNGERKGIRLERDLLDKYYKERWRGVPGGGTIGVRSISLTRIIGYEFMHIFGLDSCLSPEGVNHPWEQDWNKPDKNIIDVWCAMRKFRCSGWHTAQADQFYKYVQTCGEHFNLSVHGDGLIAHMMKTGASAERRNTEGE